MGNLKANRSVSGWLTLRDYCGKLVVVWSCEAVGDFFYTTVGSIYCWSWCSEPACLSTFPHILLYVLLIGPHTTPEHTDIDTPIFPQAVLPSWLPFLPMVTPTSWGGLCPPKKNNYNYFALVLHVTALVYDVSIWTFFSCFMNCFALCRARINVCWKRTLFLEPEIQIPSRLALVISIYTVSSGSCWTSDFATRAYSLAFSSASGTRLHWWGFQRQHYFPDSSGFHSSLISSNTPKKRKTSYLCVSQHFCRHTWQAEHPTGPPTQALTFQAIWKSK